MAILVMMNYQIKPFLEKEAAHLFGLVESLQIHGKSWPNYSEYYLQQPGEIQIARIPEGMSGVELQTALQFWDLHSALCAYLIFVYWRAEQLSRTLKSTLLEWDLIPSASMARALIESVSAFIVESRKIKASWDAAKGSGPLTPESASALRMTVQNEILQFLWGTRRKDYLSGMKSPVLQRNNILGLIDKAAKITCFEKLRDKYEELCDAVHPSFGSNECFYTEMGQSEETGWIRVLFARYALGRSDLPKQIIEASVWSIETLLAQLKDHKSFCDSICVTLKLGYIPDFQYFGIVRPHKLSQ